MTTAARSTWLRAAVLVLLLTAGLALALVVELPGPTATRAAVDGGGVAGLLGAVVAVAVVLLAPVPRSAVSVLLGVALGWSGLGIAYAGGLLAALGAFALGRCLGRSAVLRLAGPRLSRVDGAVSERTFLAVMTARLIPVVPFAAVNYGAALSGARATPYLAATALGMLPSTVVQVGLGATAGSLVRGLPPASPALVAAASVAVLVAVLLASVWALSRRRRRRATA